MIPEASAFRNLCVTKRPTGCKVIVFQISSRTA